MSSRFAQLLKYFIYALFSALVYGFLLYYGIFVMFKDIAGDSLMTVYIGNAIVIFFSLAVDKIIHGILESKKFVITKKNYRIARFFSLDTSVSFKAALYLFYIFALVLSHVIELHPTLVNDDIGVFFTTIEYGILLVIALDALMGQVSIDIDRMNRLNEKFDTYLSGFTSGIRSSGKSGGKSSGKYSVTSGDESSGKFVGKSSEQDN